MRVVLVSLAVLGSVFGCGGEGDGACDPTRKQCVVEHDFGTFTLEASSEDTGRCMSWTMSNPTEMWVNTVEVRNGGGLHHSNWFFVPDNNFDLPDGSWDCAEHNFGEISAAIAGGVLYAQSTQATEERQQFKEGAALRIPPYSRLIAFVHTLNATDEPLSTFLNVRIHTVPREQVVHKLAPFRLGYLDIDIPPMSRKRLESTCDIKSAQESQLNEDFGLTLHYVLPHFHDWGTGFRVGIAGGSRDGETIFQMDTGIGDANGYTLPEPLPLHEIGATGFEFSCTYANPFATSLYYGDAEGEMCYMLGFAESTMAFAAQVERGDTTSTETLPDGLIVSRGDCGVTGFPFDQDKEGGTGR